MFPAFRKKNVPSKVILLATPAKNKTPSLWDMEYKII
jgi:hypothetical protein